MKPCTAGPVDRFAVTKTIDRFAVAKIADRFTVTELDETPALGARPVRSNGCTQSSVYA
ncbi:MAG: hypothetical protein LAN84_14025 [Acidobacteriia bacterium]|nr:hypothetical protein [Terriglobia bacterium]